MSTISNTVETTVPAWKKAGLPGMPVVAKRDYQVIAPSEVIRDANGRPIICTRGAHRILWSLKEYFRGKGIFDKVSFVTDVAEFERFKANRTRFEEPPFLAESFGLALPVGEIPLSIPHRAAVAAIALLLSSFSSFSIPRQEAYQFPVAMQEMREFHEDTPAAAPFRAYTEEKAYQLARLVEHILLVEADVINEDGTYYVTFPHTEALSGGDRLIRLYLAATLLEDFDLIPTVEVSIKPIESEDEIVAESIRIGKIHNMQKRIEAKLDALIARVSTPAESTTTTTTTTAAEPGRDAHVRPTKTKQSGKTKASA